MNDGREYGTDSGGCLLGLLIIIASILLAGFIGWLLLGSLILPIIEQFQEITRA